MQCSGNARDPAEAGEAGPPLKCEAGLQLCSGYLSLRGHIHTGVASRLKTLCLPEHLLEEHAAAVLDTPLGSPAAHTHT